MLQKKTKSETWKSGKSISASSTHNREDQRKEEEEEEEEENEQHQQPEREHHQGYQTISLTHWWSPGIH